MTISLVILAFIFVIGLVIGSFLNVVILRTVSEESIVFPASKCPKCQTPLKWYHNIPVLSYLFLKGKCAFCHEKISVQYPLVELFSGIMFVVLYFKYCNPFDELFGLAMLNPIDLMSVINYIFVLIVFSLFVVMAGTDLIEKQVANIHTYSLIGCGILYGAISSITHLVAYSNEFGAPKFDWNLFLTCPLFLSIATGILGFVLMEALSLIGILLVKSRAFGEGDSYIVAGIGSVFGAILASNTNFLVITKILIGMLILAVILQIVATFPILLGKLAKNKDWLTLSLIISFVIYTLGYAFAQNNGWLINPIAYILSTIVLLAVGLLTCKELILGLKRDNKSNTGLYLPFGPALLLSALIIMIYL